MAEPITEDWLRECGFKWSQLDRQPERHWLLWLGDAIPDPSGRLNSYDDIGLEVAPRDQYFGGWNCWFRSDVAGRYSRFIHVRPLFCQDDLVKLIEAITGLPWNSENSMYGSYRTTEQAERLRKEEQRLDLKWTKESKWRTDEPDDIRQTKHIVR